MDAFVADRDSREDVQKDKIINSILKVIFKRLTGAETERRGQNINALLSSPLHPAQGSIEGLTALNDHRGKQVGVWRNADRDTTRITANNCAGRVGSVRTGVKRERQVVNQCGIKRYRSESLDLPI